MNAYLYQYLMAIPVVILQVLLFVLIIALLSKRDRGIRAHLQKYGVHYALLLALASILGSLGFSEIFAYEACTLCWVQRIFHYPQFILFAVAMKLKDTKVWVYSAWLAALGFGVSLYQILLQFASELSLPEVCVQAAQSCSDIQVSVFGYVSIPVMSATLFASFLMLALFQKKQKYGNHG